MSRDRVYMQCAGLVKTHNMISWRMRSFEHRPGVSATPCIGLQHNHLANCASSPMNKQNRQGALHPGVSMHGCVSGPGH